MLFLDRHRETTVSRFPPNLIRAEYVFTRLLSHESFTSRSTGGKLCQFGRRDFRLQKTTVQTNRQLREHPDARFVPIFASGEMHNHLTRKFGLIVGPARWIHKTPFYWSIPASMGPVAQTKCGKWINASDGNGQLAMWVTARESESAFKLPQRTTDGR